MGHDPTHREGVGRIPPQGGPQADMEDTLDREGRRVDIPPAGRCDGGGGPAGGGDLCLLPPEHSRTVYCDQAYYVPVSGGGAETRAMGIQEVVVAGMGGCEGDTYGGSGGGKDGGGEGRRIRWRHIGTTSWVGVHCSKRNLRDGS